MGQPPRCLVCKVPMTPNNPRLTDRSRENNLCPSCYAKTTLCECGCRRGIPLYNGRGTRIRFYGNHYARTNKARDASRKRLRDMLGNLWQDPEYREGHVGKNHHRWKGGVSLSSKGFTKELKALAKERDNFTCQNPICPYRERANVFHVHHIDGNTANNVLGNLITLCIYCHMTTHAFRTAPLSL